MNQRPQVSIVGSGNLAWHLGPALDNAGFVVREVYSRNKEQAKKLIERLYQGVLIPSLDLSESNSGIVILAVSDDAIEEVCQEIILPVNVLLVHTSGAKSIEILDFSAASGTGVFYPLQTFSKMRPLNFSTIPVCIEANNPQNEQLLMDVATSISKKVMVMSSDTRKRIHLAAVFACNFVNHMLTIAHHQLTHESVDLNILEPLIRETIDKALSANPGDVQTGPAKRKDYSTIEMHTKLLNDEEGFEKIYRLITQHIMDYYDL